MKRLFGILSCMLFSIVVLGDEPKTAEEVDKAIVEQLKLLNKKMETNNTKLDKVLAKKQPVGVTATRMVDLQTTVVDVANPGPQNQAVEVAGNRSDHEQIKITEGVSQPRAFATGCVSRTVEIHNPDAITIQVKFPADPSKENLKKYIEEIRKATKKQKHFWENDPQVDMYAKVGHDNLDLLLEAYRRSKNRNEGKYHLQDAIKKLLTKDDRGFITKNFPKNHFLISYIIRYGWEKDVKQVLIDYIRKTKTPDLSPGWAVAVVVLKDPESYPDLLKCFAVSSSRVAIYEYIKDLPGIDLDKAVDDAWKVVSKQKKHWWRDQFSLIAAQHGHTDALFMALTAKVTDNYISEILPGLNILLAEQVEKSGSTLDTKQWLLNNRKNIVYDMKDKKYKLKSEN